MGLETEYIPSISEAQVLWDPDGDDVELGPVLGRIAVKCEQEVQEVKQSGFGNLPVDWFPSGKVGVTVEFDTTRNTLANLLLVLYGAAVGTATGSIEAVVENKSGGAMYTGAKKVIIKPLVDDVASSTKSEWLTIFKASEPREIMDLGYAVDEQKIIKVEMKIFPDRTSGNVGKLWKVGEDV